jgi:hypothetical protein
VDEEGLEIDIAEAIGKATAAICLEGALVAVLVTKGILTNGEAAELTGLADVALTELEGIPDDVRLLAASALRGFAGSWTKHVTKN